MNNTQLTDFKNYDAKRLLFSKPEVGTIPGSMSKLTFKRIRIATKNSDGTVGDLVIATPPNLMCYGLQEQTDPSTGAVNGYQFPLVLWNRNEPTLDEKTFTDTINKICDACKDHLIAHREEIEKYDLEMNDLKKFNPLYFKMEKGKVVEGKGPMLYIKTLTSKKADTFKIYTVFTDAETNELIEPMDLMNKRCYVQGAIKIESIFVGNKISLQMKLFEARVNVIDTAFRSLLNPSVVIRQDEPKKPLLTGAEEDIPQPEPQGGFTETGSLMDEEESSDEEEEDDDTTPTETTTTTTTPTPAPPASPPKAAEEKPKPAAKKPAAKKK